MDDSQPWGLSRRGLLAAGAATGALLVVGALSACTSSANSDPNAPPPTGADDPDFELRGTVVAAEVALIAAYDATIKAHAGLRATLQPLRDNHAAHLAAVNIGSAVAIPTPAPPAIPDSPRAAVRQLASMEGTAATERGANCLTASRWQFARELSLIGASEASHHAALIGGNA